MTMPEARTVDARGYCWFILVAIPTPMPRCAGITAAMNADGVRAWNAGQPKVKSAKVWAKAEIAWALHLPVLNLAGVYAVRVHQFKAPSRAARHWLPSCAKTARGRVSRLSGPKARSIDCSPLAVSASAIPWLDDREGAIAAASL
jgi:hypothetical protein